MSASAQFSKSSSKPTVVSPFGSTPFNIAQQTRRGFSQPLAMGFGIGDPTQKGYQNFQQRLAGSQGPTASFINQAQPITQQFLPQQQGLSQELMTNARSAYGGYQQSLDQFMKQLPGFQQQAGAGTGAGEEALGYARGYAKEAFSPLQGRAMFQEASQRALAPAREGAAARGLLESGQAQAGEQDLLSNLAYQALQGEQGNQQAAIAQLGQAGGALQNLVQQQAGIAGLAPQAAEQALAGAGQYSQLMQGLSQLPLGAAQQLMSFLQQSQNPNMALLQAVAPTVAQKSSAKSGGSSASLSDRRLKRVISADVPGLEAVTMLEPVSYEYIQPNPLDLDADRHYGLVAQDVAVVAPHAITTDSGYLAIDYHALVAVLIRGIQELTTRVAALEATQGAV